jgi:hypothetical protein
MNADQAIAEMVSPSQRRPGKWREGVMQIHLNRICDLACSNCTQGSQFGGKNAYMSLQNFERACKSMKGYFGLIGIFGGNPALHPHFAEICQILRSHFPKEQCGIWCNNPHGKAHHMALTFNPSMSNLNVHLRQDAYDDFKDGWPDSAPFGLTQDSRHSPVHGALHHFVSHEDDRWNLIANCDINRHWSAMLCQFRGELRGFFCEVAGGQAILNQFNPDYPDTGMPICEFCNGTGRLEAYRGEPSQGTEMVACDGCDGVAWWKRPMQSFGNQVKQHCPNCLVPLRGHGALAQQQHVTTITSEYAHLPIKNRHELVINDGGTSLHPETSRRVIDYLGK